MDRTASPLWRAPAGRGGGPAGPMDRPASPLWRSRTGGGGLGMIGRFWDGVREVGSFVDFSARTVAAMPRAAVFRAGELVRQFERVTWGSLPIVAVAGASV